MEENPDRNLKDKYTAAEKKISAIVLAAGSGRRMHSGEKKQFMDLCGMPVVVHSLLAFEKNKNLLNHKYPSNLYSRCSITPADKLYPA